MKKQVLASVLGVAGLLGLTASSYGQAQIFFDNYVASPYYNVQYAGTGVAAGTEVSVELGYAVGAGQTTGFTLLPATITTINPAASQPNNGVGPAVGGWFDGPIATLTGVGSGQAATLEVLAWTTTGGTTFANAAFTGTLIWTEPGATLGGNGLPASNFTAMPGSVILNPTVVPEPTTLALAGLGSLASLVALRRKQS
jgi:PEP-CTERM motif